MVGRSDASREAAMDGFGESDLARAALDALTERICVLDRAGTIVWGNAAWAAFTDAVGIGANYLQACSAARGRHKRHAQRFGLGVQAVLEGARAQFVLDYPCERAGETRWSRGVVTPLRAGPEGQGGKEGPVTGAVISHEDITAQRAQARRLQEAARTDALTGLPDRARMRGVLERALGRRAAGAQAPALVLADLDQMRALNTSLGQKAGDRALTFAAARMRAQARGADTLGRMGGAEFALVLPATDPWGATMAAERLRRALAEAPFRHGGCDLAVTASFGVAAALGQEDSADAILARAGAALAEAKRQGGNRVRGE